MKGNGVSEKDLFKNGILMSLVFSICLTFLDFYLGQFHVILSWRTYAAFWMAYFIANLLIWLIILAIYKFRRQKAIAVNFNYIIALIFLFDFVLINVKLNGWFNFLNLRSIIDNSLLILCLAIWVYGVKRKPELQSKFKTFAFNVKVFFLTIGITSIINFSLLHLPDPPTNKLEVLAFTLLVGVIPILATYFIHYFENLLSKLIPTRILPLLSNFIILIIILIAAPLLKAPDYSHFYNSSIKAPISNNKTVKKSNIIWIVLDTARRDHFSCYGYTRKTTSHIDEFAKDGVLFTNYISTAPWTLPSHASLFTGLYSSEHGAHFARKKGPLYFPLTKDVKTIAEILSENGWNTAAISANAMINKTNNLDQGFQFFYSKENGFREFFWGMLTSQVFPDIWNEWGFLRINVYKLSSELNKVIFHYLKKEKSSPFFLFVNYMEAHHGAKYIPGPAGSRFGVDWGKWKEMYDLLDLEAIVTKKKKIPENAYQLNRDWLDTKMAYLDENIGQLFEFLKKNGLYDNSYIFLLSDHGDLFGEHYSFGHTMELYNELIHVPLIIKYPKGMERVGTNNNFVQNVDLMPEVLAQLNLPIPEGIKGLPIDQANHDIVSELFRRNELKLNKPRYSRDLKSIIAPYMKKERIFKFIQFSNGQHELYDFTNDHEELENLYSKSKQIAGYLENKLSFWRKNLNPISSAGKKEKLDKKTLDKLKALGYIR